MDRHIRVSLRVINTIEIEQRARESYSDTIQRLLGELAHYRKYLGLHPELPIPEKSLARGRHA